MPQKIQHELDLARRTESNKINSSNEAKTINPVSDKILLAPHEFTSEQVAHALDVDVAAGLTEAEAARRLEAGGPNVIEEIRPNRLRHFLTSQVSSLVIWLLAFASVVSWLTGNELEAGAILVVLVLNAVIGFAIEWRAGNALDALRKSTRTFARVRRGGREKVVDASNLTEGDVVSVTAGDRVPAGARIFEAFNLRTDESGLTGESLPVEKDSVPVKAGTPLAERCSMLFFGTTVVAGRGTAIVTATGIKTEMGRIGQLVAEAAPGQTPLELKLAGLGRKLVLAVLGIALLTWITGIIRGEPLWLMLEVSISLAVAAVPEGLPAVTTLILALGVLRMARHNAIVRRLSAVETLGGATVICADKTGTLTENRMTVQEYFSAGGETLDVSAGTGKPQQLGDLSDKNLKRILLGSVLCNEAGFDPNKANEERVIGDPTETALLVGADKLGFDPEDERGRFVVLFEQPFDTSTKRMTVAFSDRDGNRQAALKGAPSVVLSACRTYLGPDGELARLDKTADTHFREINRKMAGRALRVLAFAEKNIDPGSDPADQIDDDFTFLGFVGLADPPRTGAAEAVEQAQTAGIRVVMLTGDQLDTARAIARELHIGKDSQTFAWHSRDLAEADGERIAEMARQANVFARVTPEDKLSIVKALQSAGEVVAVTGDGVNDAPALKHADIGVAMGLRGTEVAKESADIVLTDDNFKTIVTAIEGGRTIYSNITKFVHMMFSHNLGEVLFIFGAIFAGLPLPLLPLQILWINLVTDVFPALALAVEPPSRDAMRRKPHAPDEALLSNRFMFLILWQGTLLAAIAMGAYLWALNEYGPGAHSQTIAMLAIVGMQLGHFFNCRSRVRSAFKQFFSNPYIFAAAAIVLLLQLVAVNFPPLMRVLGSVTPNSGDWAIVAVSIILPVVIVEITKLFARPNAPAPDAP